MPLSKVSAQWVRGDDPAVHVRALQKIIDLGGTPFAHSGQADQPRVVDFYGRHVLPYVHRRRASDPIGRADLVQLSGA
ncbi:hypothetical protein GCM10009835_32020 [Planosporangium flavigriseum]